MRINELDSDTPGTDALEFVELYDGGVGNTSLTGLVVVFYNGSNDLSYAAFDLDGFSTNGAGYFTLGNAAVTGVDLTFAGNVLQNGQDAVGLYTANATDFPTNTPVTTANLVDAVVYDTADADDAGLLVLLNGGQPQVDENSGGPGDSNSIQRCPNGSGGLRNTSTYLALAPTPDGPNSNCPVVTGACCDRVNLVCTDGVEQGACPDEWTASTLCASLNPPCAAAPIGACCDDSTGVCTEGIEEANCLGRWGGDGSTCMTIDPPCVAPTGACCASGFCGDNFSAADCAAAGGLYQGNNSTCGLVQCPAGVDVVINEFRMDQVGADNDEFFELSGRPGDSLDGLFYIVIGDGVGVSGVIESVTPLSGLVIPADGYFLAVESTFTLGGFPDLTVAGNGLNFENTDNTTHLLVAGFYGAIFDDLDTNDDCVLDSMPWLGELDRIANIIENNPPGTTECHYGPPIVGPEVNDGGTFAPGLAPRCPDTIGPFVIGLFDPLGTQDSPGAANPCPVCGNGIVEAGEDCDGGACCTPGCGLLSGAICRASLGDCDLPEICDGVSADCPADVLVDAGTICRNSGGVCDPAEVCTGQSPDCPADAREPAGTECRASGGDCDVAEVCDGQGVACPPNLLVPANTTCRNAAGDCDVAEVCDGATVSCPPDNVRPDGFTCRGAAGPCDVAEVCDGETVDCPGDELALAGTTCHPSTGPCDPAEVCDGQVVTCPSDQQITACIPGDFCCPTGCDAVQDTDCESVCGNNVVEPGETCDDGNTTDGDGCSATCQDEFTPIPTVSEWGLVILALVLIITGKLAFRRQAALA